MQAEACVSAQLLKERMKLDTLQFVIFPSPHITDPILKRLLALLCESAPVYYVTSRPKEEFQEHSEPEELNYVLRSALPQLWNENTIAFVAHPYWVHAAASMHPRHIITYEPAHLDESDEGLYKACMQQLTAISSLVCSDSEMKCLDWAFRGYASLLLQEESAVYDVLFQEAIHELIRSETTSVHRRQWSERAAYYESLREQSGPHETVSFLLSVYMYLLEDKNALRYAEEAFLQAVMQGRNNALITHYRFLSAIQAQQGNLTQAVSTYGITAYSDADTNKYHSLLQFMADGQGTTALFHIYRFNDDYRAALSMLDLLSEQNARHLSFQLYRETGRLEKALGEVAASDLQTDQDRREFRILSGSVEAMRGDRHTAIRLFMEAAESDEDVLVQIIALDALDEKLRILEQGS